MLIKNLFNFCLNQKQPLCSLIKQSFAIQNKKICTNISDSMDLKVVVKRLNEYANFDLACDWDNVGLLVEPSEFKLVKKILVTNDLTESVLDEAIGNNIDLIVSYHPPIFKPLKRLTQSEWKQRSIIKCIEKNIAVFSPHTTWDSVSGGINDAIINAFDPKSVEPVETLPCLNHPCGFAKSAKINLLNNEAKTKFLDYIKSRDNISFVNEKSINFEDKCEIEFLCSAKGIVDLIEAIKSNFDVDTLSTLRIYDLSKPILKNSGLGRLGVLKQPICLAEVVQKLKEITKLKHVRLALGNGKKLDDKVTRIGVGAGSGSKLLNNLNVDVLITGEFQHHEILHETHRGVSLILTDHTNTERLYFPVFKKAFSELLEKRGEKLEIMISSEDRDPLEII